MPGSTVEQSIEKLHFSTWQLISLAEECNGHSEATIIHEMIHAWGFQHEHSRPDRKDIFIKQNHVLKILSI